MDEQTMSPKLLFIIIYFACVSLLSVLLTVIDKHNAKRNRRRVSEKALFLSAIFGGSLFEYLTMKTIRHKTLHKRFMIGLPIIFILQVLLIAFLYFRFIKTGIVTL